MKNITSLIAMAMLSTMSINVLTSCSNDDDPVLTAPVLHGTWMHNDRLDDDYDYLRFNPDGTGSKWEVRKNDTGARPHDQESFTYTLDGNKIIFVEPDGERDVETVKLVSSNEIIIDHDTYTRQNN